MIRVGLIPLDSRPCNTIWIESLAKIAHFQLLMYPREACGNLYQGANIDCMIPWLEENAPQMDYLILSTDGLCYGGLIQARKAQIDVEKVLKQLDVIKKIKQQNIHLRIYVFDTIMRTAITAFDEESHRYYDMMNEFARLKGACYFFKKPEDIARLKEIEESIPPHILNTYVKARKTKLMLNQFFLSLAKDCIIDKMILLQEDASPYGIQAIDQVEIQAQMEKDQLTDVVEFYNGTDEGAAVLLARIIKEEYQIAPKAYLHIPSSAILKKCHLFEDRPFSENLYKMLETIGIELVNQVEDASFVLAIFAEEENHPLELKAYIEVPIRKDEVYRQYIQQLNCYMQQKPVLLVDLFFPNGGSIELLQDVEYRKLLGYSAWNTSSNSLGTALCNAMAYLVHPESATNKDFLKERIMDDCIYQYIARRKASETLIQKGCSIYNLESDVDFALSEVSKWMHQYDDWIDYTPYQLILPWGRMFEIEIKVEEESNDL